MKMTPRERVEAALLGRWADQVPFTSYENKFFYSQTERELRNDGFCIVELRVPVAIQENPAVQEETFQWRGEDGMLRMRRAVRTERGTISELLQQVQDDPRIPRQWLPWHKEYLFKGPEDYAPIEAMIRGQRYRANHEAFRRAQEEAGGDLILMAAQGYSPLLEIIYNIMGIEQFAFEWAERRDEVLKLHDVLTEDRRKLYPLLAESPALIVNYCGNVSPEVVGLERFEKYVVPHYNELAELLHPRGKLLGVHFDAHTRLLREAIARSQVDYIEAFTPWPVGDMSVAEARAAWPDKVLWVNFTSSVHLAETSQIEETTRQILREGAPGNKLLIGITETVPANVWQRSFKAIAKVIREEGQLPLR